MSLFPFFKKKPFFSADEQQQIVAAIKAAEQQTSGEIRVFVESHCRFVDPLDRAAEVFFHLKMDATSLRDGVLLYVAMKDRQLAIFGDQGIHEKVGDVFWSEMVKKILSHFNNQHYVRGLVHVVEEIATALTTYFPHDGDHDKNELPDDIVFGR
jgi:uncharacterized membrane protein